jgi:hypothetical protein
VLNCLASVFDGDNKMTVRNNTDVDVMYDLMVEPPVSHTAMALCASLAVAQMGIFVFARLARESLSAPSVPGAHDKSAPHP